MRDHDQQLYELAMRQHNHVTTAQLRAIGMTRSEVRCRRERGLLVRVRRGILRLGGAAPTPHEPLMVALLHAGEEAVIGYGTAAAFYGLAAYRLDPVHVLVRREDRTGHDPGFYRPHSSRLLLPDHIVEADGLRLTTPARTMRDLAMSLDFVRLGAGVDKLWARGQLSGRQFSQVHLDLQKRGRAGTVKSRAVADVRGPEYVPPESNLEGRAGQQLATWYGPVWRRQVETGDDVRWIGRVDLRHDFLPAIIEIDSDLYHGSLTDVAHDDARRKALEEAGFCFASVSDFVVWHDASEFRRIVDDLLARARRSRDGGSPDLDNRAPQRAP